MTFDRPALLLGLFGLFPLALFQVLHWRRLRPSLEICGGDRGPAPDELFRRFLLSSLALLLFSAFSVLALAGPRQGAVMAPDTRRQTDAVLALDLSRSMDLRDAGPAGGLSRLERALALARELVAEDGGRTRFAAAIGKGAGTLAVPLTQDGEALSSFLGGISTDTITGQGTNLESLLDAASGAFLADFPSRRRILLFSDGEALRGTVAKALDASARADIAIIAVGLGSEAGVPVSGEALSRLERAVLENAARRTGGVYIDGNSADAGRLLAESIAGPGGAAGNFRRESPPAAHWFIMAAIVCFAFSKLPGRKWSA